MSGLRERRNTDLKTLGVLLGCLVVCSALMLLRVPAFTEVASWGDFFKDMALAGEASTTILSIFSAPVAAIGAAGRSLALGVLTGVSKIQSTRNRVSNPYIKSN